MGCSVYILEVHLCHHPGSKLAFVVTQLFYSRKCRFEAGEWDVAEKVFQKTKEMLWGDYRKRPEACTLVKDVRS